MKASLMMYLPMRNGKSAYSFLLNPNLITLQFYTNSFKSDTVNSSGTLNMVLPDKQKSYQRLTIKISRIRRKP
jgi:hypothetical protein